MTYIDELIFILKYIKISLFLLFPYQRYWAFVHIIVNNFT